MASTWGDSWGEAWGDSWGEIAAVVTTPPPPAGAGSAGRGGFASAWRREWERKRRYEALQEQREDQERLARLAETLKRKDQREAARRAAETAAKALERATRSFTDLSYADALGAALGRVAGATKPGQIYRGALAAEKAARDLMNMLAEALEEPPMYEMTDDDITAILLLS